MRILEVIEVLLDEELSEALGCEAYQRVEGRRGYRNGAEQRTLTTEIGTREVRVPRGRLVQDDGRTAEFRSELLPRYARRTKVIDEAILGIYLAGANSRRIRKALEPLLGTTHLSKSAVSRVVARLKALFESWSERDLSEERYAILYALRVASASFARRDLPSMFWFDENQSNELHKPHRGYATIFHGKRDTSGLGAADSLSPRSLLPRPRAALRPPSAVQQDSVL
jgi:hypothetical protein